MISETFWNDGKNRIIEVSESGDRAPRSELIVETRVNENPILIEIVRAWKDNAYWKMAFHVFIEGDPNGAETETQVYP